MVSPLPLGEPEGSIGQCIEDARAGSPEALGRLLERFRPYLLLHANRQLDPRLSAKGGASDLVQQTFLEAQQSIGAFNVRTDAELLAWLRHILDCNVLDFSRRYRGTEQRQVSRERSADEAALAVPDPDPGAAERLVDDENVRQVEAAVAELPEDYRQAIELRYREGRSFEEIGRLLDRSPAAAQKLWYRAVRRLRELLGDDADEPH